MYLKDKDNRDNSLSRLMILSQSSESVTICLWSVSEVLSITHYNSLICLKERESKHVPRLQHGNYQNPHFILQQNVIILIKTPFVHLVPKGNSNCTYLVKASFKHTNISADSSILCLSPSFSSFPSLSYCPQLTVSGWTERQGGLEWGEGSRGSRRTGRKAVICAKRRVIYDCLSVLPIGSLSLYFIIIYISLQYVRLLRELLSL